MKVALVLLALAAVVAADSYKQYDHYVSKRLQRIRLIL